MEMVLNRSCPVVSHYANMSQVARERDVQTICSLIRFPSSPMAHLEVDTDGGDEGGCPCIVTETKEQTRLSDAWNGGSSGSWD